MKIFIISLLSLLSSNLMAQGLDCSTKQINFGDITKTTKKTVTLYNRTQIPVVVLDAKVDCNCAKVSYSPRPILKGDSTIVEVTYTPKDKGAFYKTITLKNSAGADLKLIVRGTVK